MTDITKATPPQSPDGFTFDLQRFDTEGNWSDYTETVPDAVDGVITITTAEQLAALAKNVNDEDNSNSYSGVTIKLGADLDLSGHNWTPIGTINNEFAGTFDGDGHTISGLTISTGDSNVGLFGSVGTGCTVENVTLTNATVSGGWYVGGLVGLNRGTVSGNTVSGVTVSGTRNIGGLVGQNNGTVQNCTVSGEVNGKNNVGGLVGYNYRNGTVRDNTFYSNLDAVGNDIGTVDNNTRLYKLTLPEGVTVTGGDTITDGTNTYYAGTLTLSGELKDGYVYSTGDSFTISANTTVTRIPNSANHYVFSDGNGGYTLATNANVAENNYPDLTQVYALTLPDGVTASGDIVATADGKTYAAGSVTLTAADCYTLQNVSVDGESLNGNTVNVSAATTILADSIKFNNTNISKATGAEVGGTTGDLHAFSSVYSISASQNNSTLVGNAKNNTVILTGGGENILTGGGGNDTFKFNAGGGIVTDYGIGATKSGDGSTLTNPPGTDVIKLDGKVSGVYFDRDATSKKSATFTAVITYGTGDDTQIIVLKDIAKKPTKYSSDANKVVYQTNDVAAATLKIWDTSGSKQAVLSASKLKKLFHDDSELNDLGELIQAKVTYLGEIADGNTPATNPFEQTTTITSNGDDNG